jgi:hypothetical protein
MVATIRTHKSEHLNQIRFELNLYLIFFLNQINNCKQIIYQNLRNVKYFFTSCKTESLKMLHLFSIKYLIMTNVPMYSIFDSLGQTRHLIWSNLTPTI